MDQQANKRRKIGELIREIHSRPRVGLSPQRAKLFDEDRRAIVSKKKKDRLELFGIDTELANKAHAS